MTSEEKHKLEIKRLQKRINNLNQEIKKQKDLVCKYRARCISKDALIESMSEQMQRIVIEHSIESDMEDEGN